MLYSINVDNNGDAKEGRRLPVPLHEEHREPQFVPLQHGAAHSLTDPDLNIRQTYSVTRWTPSSSTVLGSNIPVPPPTSGLGRTRAIRRRWASGPAGGRKVFAGPRDDPFFVDLGSIFDLAGLRPFNAAHLIPLATAKGEDGVEHYNTHAIAIQVPKTDLLQAPNADGNIGIYASASRQKIRVLNGNGTASSSGDWVQVSRLGNPLINEVIIPLGQKDYWNASDPKDDSQFLARYTNPELAVLVNFLYPGLPDTPTTNRNDLVAVLLTGVPGLNNTEADASGPAPAEHGHRPDCAAERLGCAGG